VHPGLDLVSRLSLSVPRRALRPTERGILRAGHTDPGLSKRTFSGRNCASMERQRRLSDLELVECVAPWCLCTQYTRSDPATPPHPPVTSIYVPGAVSRVGKPTGAGGASPVLGKADDDVKEVLHSADSHMNACVDVGLGKGTGAGAGAGASPAGGASVGAGDGDAQEQLWIFSTAARPKLVSTCVRRVCSSQMIYGGMARGCHLAAMFRFVEPARCHGAYVQTWKTKCSDGRGLAVSVQLGVVVTSSEKNKLTVFSLPKSSSDVINKIKSIGHSGSVK
jgi:hypothetical protein